VQHCLVGSEMCIRDRDHGTAWIGHKRRVLYAFLRGPIGLFRVEYVLEFFFVKLGVMT
jgi:hypothetical protein